jgi:hypothetical protein
MNDSSPATPRSQVPIDRYESTFVVSLDSSKGDFTSLQAAINKLPATGVRIPGEGERDSWVKVNAVPG